MSSKGKNKPEKRNAQSNTSNHTVKDQSDQQTNTGEPCNTEIHTLSTRKLWNRKTT